MGFIGTMLKTIFSPNVQQASSQAPTVTGRDLLPSTSNEEPESAVMGSDKKKDKNGISSLLVPSENLYKGGN